MTKPWLSILVPVYNVQDYLQDCLNSILSQSDAGVEIILLDDNSTDSSWQLMQEAQSAHPHPLKLLRHEQHQGVSAARNSLIEQAQGEYVWFVDSDDALSDGAVRELQEIVTAHHPDLIMCDFFMWRRVIKLKHRIRGELHRKSFIGPENHLSTDLDALFYGLYACGQLHIWSKISKRELWQGLRFPVGRLMEDVTVSPRLFMQVKNYFYATRVWVAYRQRPGSILSTPNPKLLVDTSKSTEGILRDWLQAHPHLSSRSHFVFAHFCAKLFIGIARNLQKTGNKSLLKTHQNDFLTNTQSSRGWLIKQYLKRGWVLRLGRLLFHLR